MRTDFYQNPLIPAEAPPAPQPEAPAPKKRRGHAMPLFLFFLFLILTGIVALGWFFEPKLPELIWPDVSSWQLPSWSWSSAQPSQSPAPSAAQSAAIPTAPPAGDRPLALLEGEAEALSAKEIYAAVSPAVLTVTAGDDSGPVREGTGVLFDARGYVVTNAHIIEGLSKVMVTLSDERSFPALLVGCDQQTDLAVLTFVADRLTAAPFAADDTMSVGDSVYAIGNPLGSQFRGSMSEGIVSAIDRNVTVGDYEMSLIQTTAALNTGNSGGALVDAAGRVVGVTNMKMMSWSSTIEGLGFAIPSSTVAKVVNDIMEVGHVTGRPVLGITVRPAKPEECAQGGLLVVEVSPSSDAWAKGLREGDVLLTANGIALVDNQDLLTLRVGLVAGDAMTLTWLSPGKSESQEAEVLLVEQYLLE